MRVEEKTFLDAIDIDYSYGLAKRLEQFRTNDALGYRTAGSKAEFDTGELLVQEMKAIGIPQVRKDAVKLDSWEFKKAVMRYEDHTGEFHEYQLGAYQTNFRTDGFRPFSLVYVGKGTARDYEGVDVTGKLVLVEINQRDEWWINFPVYQACKKGAAALIAVQEGGYGEINEAALNAQDIAGPANAPAFSMSQLDASLLKQELQELGEISVEFDADSQVRTEVTSYNIVGTIPGREADSALLLSAHYDSYFSGFQDDNVAVAMMLGIAKALLTSGYRPQKTLIFCAMTGEEWGLTNSKYDWSVGAYQQVFMTCPQWQGTVVADLNFELPAHAHQKKDAIRCVYEYVDFLEAFISGIDVDPAAYPEGIEVCGPIQTWSDDFSMAIAGIPSMVNDFSDGSFMETHYHSQFDNENVYQEPVYLFHHQLYGRLVMAFDRTAVAPLNFSALFHALGQRIDLEYSRQTDAKGDRLFELAACAKEVGKTLYSEIQKVNDRYASYLELGQYEKASELFAGSRQLEKILLHVFRKGQDSFVRLNWHDEVLFPQEAVRANLLKIQEALSCLEQGQIGGALEAIYDIDNNRYAFLFDEEVFTYFTEYVTCQPRERLLWGAGRIVHHENLFQLVKNLKEKRLTGETDTKEEYELLKTVEKNQLICYCDDISYMIREIESIIKNLGEIKGV